jgi:tRNA threonylcarbamoyladenosine biosynthesis protein TsaB
MERGDGIITVRPASGIFKSKWILDFAMITLAIEQSSARGSLALLRDQAVLEERTWEHSWNRNQQLFDLLPDILASTGLRLDEVDVFAAGLGPGFFSGNRIAVSAARAFALPGAKHVFGLSSGEALAYDVLRETGSKRVVIVGDARQHHVWYAQFERGDQWPAMVVPWSLHPADKISEILGGDAVVACPDWERLAGTLAEGCASGARLIEGNRYPSAGSVGLLAFRKIGAGTPSEELSPIYLHPAVSRLCLNTEH